VCCPIGIIYKSRNNKEQKEKDEDLYSFGGKYPNVCITCGGQIRTVIIKTMSLYQITEITFCVLYCLIFLLLLWHSKPMQFKAFHFPDSGILFYRHLVGLLRRGTGLSQGLYLHRKTQIQKKYIHPCPEWDSNSQSVQVAEYSACLRLATVTRLFYF
jgi:hypothetical protein